MTRRDVCPECGSDETERVWLEPEWDAESIQEIRICDGCQGQYTLYLGVVHTEYQSPEDLGVDA